MSTDMDIEPCMFCLEVTKNDDEVITIILNQYERGTCNCRIYTHVTCWMSYILHKGYAECPICHTVVIIASAPSLSVQIHRAPIIENESQEINIVHNNQVYQYRIPSTPTTHQIIIPNNTTTNTVQWVTCKNSKMFGCLLSLTLILMITFYFIRVQ
jgi:hypothetical protein